MELYAKNMFFQGNTIEEKEYDYCIHGNVVFKIGDKSLSNEKEWCISASAYKFLCTLFKNHFIEDGDFLIPCCGHFIILSDDKKIEKIMGCNSGIDFNVIHGKSDIIIKTEDNIEYNIPFVDYKIAVLSFAKQVIDFYKLNSERKFTDEYDKEGYNVFIAELNSLYNKANLL